LGLLVVPIVALLLITRRLLAVSLSLLLLPIPLVALFLSLGLLVVPVLLRLPIPLTLLVIPLSLLLLSLPLLALPLRLGQLMRVIRVIRPRAGRHQAQHSQANEGSADPPADWLHRRSRLSLDVSRHSQH